MLLLESVRCALIRIIYSEIPMADKPVRDKLRFRKLLGSLSDGLGSQNLRELKNLCYDNIGEQKREQVSDGLALFNVLLEQGQCTPHVVSYTA